MSHRSAIHYTCVFFVFFACTWGWANAEAHDREANRIARILQTKGYQAPQGKRSDVFLYAFSDKTVAWQGEQITVSWLLFTRSELLKYEPTPPSLSGLWSETLFEPSAFFSYGKTGVNGREYLVTLVSKRALFATKAGTLEIAPLSANVATLRTALGRFESISSNALFMEVKALPTPAPAGFDSTYVGTFTLEVLVDKTELDADQSLTLQLHIEGKGALQRTQTPNLNLPRFKLEEIADFVESISQEGGVVGGSRDYRYWTTPKHGGDQQIPRIELPYFDPGLGRYQIARSQAIVLRVNGQPHAEEGYGSELIVGESSHAESETPELPIVLVLATSGLLIGGALCLWLWRIRNRRKHSPRPQSVERRSTAHLRLATKHRENGRVQMFYAEMGHAICCAIELRIDEEIAGRSQAERLRLLESHSVETSLAIDVVEQLAALEQARFSPMEETAEIGTIERRVHELLQRLE